MGLGSFTVCVLSVLSSSRDFPAFQAEIVQITHWLHSHHTLDPYSLCLFDVLGISRVIQQLSFTSGLFYVVWCFQGSFVLDQILELDFFLWPSVLLLNFNY